MWILKDISFSLERGKGFIIQGRSGCGKTTLLNIMAGLESPTMGNVLFQGKTLGSMKDDEKAILRNIHIGYCLQTTHFLNHFSILENLIVPLVLRGENIGKSRKKGVRILEKLGLNGMDHKRPAALSGGQLQRLSLGRALIGEPDLLLVDEPTGNLDETTAKDILHLILKYRSERNATLVLVTHDPIEDQTDLKKYIISDARLASPDLGSDSI
jgi:ABC-type lipoprotein export system ATPase subunit